MNNILKLIIATLLISLMGCGGGGVGESNVAKFKNNAFYDIKVDGITEFMTDLSGDMVEKNGASWTNAVGSSSTTTSSGTTGLLHFVLPLLHSAHTTSSPINNQTIDIKYSGTSGSEISASEITTVMILGTSYSIQVVLDALYNQAFVSDNFISTSWLSIYNSLETTLTINADKTFTLKSSLGFSAFVPGNCVITGSLPDSDTNFVVVTAQYVCTETSTNTVTTGIVYPTFRSNGDNTQLTILVSATSPVLYSFSTILQKQ